MLFDKLFRIKPKDRGLIYLLKDIIVRYRSHNLSQTGGQLAFFLLLSLFPFIIFLNTLVGALNISTDMLFSVLSPILPHQITELITSYNDYLTQNQSTSLLSVGLAVSLYSASRAVRSMIYAINQAYGIREKRGFWRNLVLSIIFTLCVGIILLLTAVILTVGSGIVGYFGEYYHITIFSASSLQFVSWTLCTVILFFIVCAIYCFTPNRRISLRSVLWGSVFTILGWFVLTIGFSIYINHFSNYSVLYGSIGAIIILMLYLYLMGIVLLMGAEINSSLLELSKVHSS